MLRWRLLSSLMLVSLLVTAAYFDFRWGHPEYGGRPGIMTCLLLTAFGALAAKELAALTLVGKLATSGSHVRVVVATGLVIATACSGPLLPDSLRSTLSGEFLLLLGMILGLTVVVGFEMWNYGRVAGASGQHQVTTRIALAVLAMLYLGLPLGLIGLLRLTGTNGFGLWALLSVLVIPKISDAGAYFTGRTLGRHKLIPRLSPGKTVEGAVGAFAFGILASFLMCHVIAPYVFSLPIPLTVLGTVGYGVWVSAAGMFGDLVESMFKRDATIKDSGGWLPGLGGMLDVIDSVLLASVAAFLFWRLVPGVPLN